MTHSHSLRIPVATATVLASALLFTGCSGGAEGQQGTTDADTEAATLMLNWTPNAHHAGIYYALEHGLYEEAGIDLTILEPGADIGAEAAVAEGRADFGISQAESVLPARESGMDIQAVATLLPVNDSVLMGLEGSGLTEDPGSLAGLTYGGYGGALETEIMSELTQCGGADPTQVEFIEIGDVDYLSGLEQERFDVTWVFGGWDALRATQVRDDVVVLPLADHEACIPNWYTPVIIGNGEHMSENENLARAFLAATSEGYHAVVENPEAGAEALLAHAPELDESLVRDATDYYAPRYTTQGDFGVMETDVWERFGEFLVTAGMIEGTQTMTDAWTNAYLPTE